VLEGGRLNRVSVAVLVDGTYGKNDKGESTYQPRSKEELDQIATLVRSAIGFSQKRGDQVEIVNLRFAETAAAPITEPSGWLSAFQFTKDDIMRAIEMVVMGLLGFVVVFMVVRPLVRRIITPDERAVPALPPGGAFGDGLPIDPSLPPIPAIASGDPLKTDLNQTSKMIDMAQVQGQVHAQSVQKVGEIADKNPGETISIIRQWLHESAAA
jgi:flagellar M-ring protein FliF